MKKIFFVVNVDWFFLSHRLPLALHALKKGYEVYLLAANTGKKDEIEKYDIHFIEIPFERSGKNIFRELKCINILKKNYQKYKPNIIHQVTLKACILGSIAAKKSGIRNVINAISGLGYNFTNERKGMFQRLLKKILIYAFKSNDFYYIVQNPDDELLLQSLYLTSNDHITLIKGSGINLNEFQFSLPLEKKYVEFLFPARILYDKGVIEFIEAAKSLKNELIGKAKFILAGNCDTENKAALSENELNKLLEENYIEWIGYQRNIYSVYKNADIIVLPSYREGLPKSLIEACAVGRPIITTDVPGCKECVINGYNGLIVPAKTIKPLADAMLKLFNDKEARGRMGKNSRKLAEKEFSIENVIEKTFSIYDEILDK